MGHGQEVVLQHLAGREASGGVEAEHLLQHVHKHHLIHHFSGAVHVDLMSDAAGLRGQNASRDGRGRSFTFWRTYLATIIQTVESEDLRGCLGGLRLRLLLDSSR